MHSKLSNTIWGHTDSSKCNYQLRWE